FLEAIVQIQDLPLTRRQVFAEHAINELAHQLVIRALLDLLTIDARESLAEGGGFAIRPVDRRVERDFGRRHLLRRANLLRSFLEQPADLVFGRRSEEHTSELQSLAYLVCR